MKWVIIFLLLTSLVMAVDIPKQDYSSSDIVEMTISCQGTSLIQIHNSNQELISVQQGNNNWSATYSTASDPSTGKYSITSLCEDGTSTEVLFCVDQDGCIPPKHLVTIENFTFKPANLTLRAGETVVWINKDNTSHSIMHGDDESGILDFDDTYTVKFLKPGNFPYICGLHPSMKGSIEVLTENGSACVSEISCGNWSFCHPSGIQTRSCEDNNNCVSPTVERQECRTCQENWLCSEWSDCTGIQTRSCVDRHGCATTTNKPQEEQTCVAPSSEPEPEQPEFPEPLPEPVEPEIIPETQEPLDTSMLFLYIGIVIVLLLIGIGLYFLYQKTKISPGVLRYIKRERKKGLPDKRIKNMLLGRGWSKGKVKRAMKKHK